MKRHFLTSPKPNTHFLTILAVVLLLSVTGCNPDEGWMTDYYLDQRLNEALQNASDGVGKITLFCPKATTMQPFRKTPTTLLLPQK